MCLVKQKLYFSFEFQLKNQNDLNCFDPIDSSKSMLNIEGKILSIKKHDPSTYSCFGGYFTKNSSYDTLQIEISKLANSVNILNFMDAVLMYLDAAGIGEYIDIAEYRNPSRFFKMLEDYNVHPGIIQAVDIPMTQAARARWGHATITGETYPIFTVPDSNTLSKKEKILARITSLEKELTELQEQFKQLNSEK